MAGIMDGFSEFTNPGVSARKADKLAATSQAKQQKLAPTLLPDSLAEFAKDKPNITLQEIAQYDADYAAQQQAIQAQEHERTKNFIVDDADSVMGALGNLGVQFGAGSVRTGSQILAAPAELAAQMAQASIVSKSDEKKNKLSGRPTGGILGGTFKDGDVELGQDVTTEGKLGFIESVRTNVTQPKDKLIADARSLVNTDKEDILIESLGDDYDKFKQATSDGDYVSGVADLVAGGVGSILSNPLATLGFLAESMPQMMATAIRTPANVAYGISTAASGVETFEEEKGRKATRKEILEIMAISGSAAFAEQFSASRLLPKAVKKIPNAKAPLKDAANSLVGEKAAKKIISSTVTEGATEGYQTAAEQLAGTLDVDKIDGKEVFTGAAIGGGIGKGLAVGQVAAENVRAFSGKLAREYVASQLADAVKKSKAVQSAVDEGDTSGEGLEASEHVEVLLDPSTVPTDKAGREQRVADIDARIDDIFEEADAETDPKKQDELFQTAIDLGKEAKRLAVATGDKPSEVATNIEAIEDAPTGDVDAKENIKRVFNSMRTNPGSVTPAQARAAADSEVVTKKEAKQLTQYAELEEAIEKVTGTDVNNDVINGGHGNKGIKQFRSAFNAAQQRNDQAGQDKALADLTQFANRHVVKAQLVTAAYTAVVAGSKEAPALVERVQSEYGLGISKGSNSGEIPFISLMNEEAIALGKAVTQMSGEEFKLEPVEVAPTTQPVEPAAVASPETVQDVDTGIQRINELAKSLVDAKAKVTPALGKKIAALHPSSSTVTEVQSVLDVVSKIAAFNGVQDTKPEVETLEVSTPKEVDEIQQEAITDDTQEILPTEETAGGLRENTDGTSDVETGTTPNSEVATNSLRSRNLGLRPSVNTFTSVVKKGVRGVLAKNFTAKADKSNMLHQVEDFFDTYATDNRIVHDLTVNQKTGLDMLVNFDHGMRQSIFELFRPIRGKHTVKKGANEGKTIPLIDFSEDMFQNLASIDGKLDNNLLGAISVASADWLTGNAKDNLYNSDEDINKILGRPRDQQVGPVAKAALFEVGTVRSVIAESLGRAILASTGIRANSDIDGQLKGNLAVALGQMAIAAMIDQGLLTEVQVNSNKLATLKDAKAKPGDPVAYTSFLRVANVPNGNGYLMISPLVASVVDGIQNSEGLLTTVFGVTNRETGPTFKEPTTVVENIKGTFQKVNQTVRDVIKKHQKRPHYIKEQALNVWSFLPEDVRRNVLGYEDDMLANTHVYHHPTVIGVNSEVERSMENVDKFVVRSLAEKAGLAAKFFFSHEVWKNGRLGMISNTINLQGDKLHRHLFGMDAWNITIDPADQFMMIQAKLAIAEGLGVKVDKLTVGEALAEFDQITNSNIIKNAVKSIKVVGGKRAVQARTTDKHINAITAGIDFGGEKVYTLDALINLAKMSESEPFEFDLFREVDGITNGVAIGTWQLGAASNEIDMEQRLAKTGIYFVQGGPTVGERNQDANNKDSYEDLSEAWDAAMQFYRQGATRDSVLALDALIFGENVVAAITRAMSKNPLMITNYGAAIQGVINAFAEGVVGDTYTAIAKAKNQKELDAIAKRVSEVTGSNFTLVFGAHLNKLMTPKQDQAMRDLVQVTYGAALETALDSKYKEFAESRTKVNQAVSIMFDAFSIRYKVALDKAEDEAGRVLSDAERQEIVTSMYDSVPLFNNYFSMKSGNREEMTLGMKTRKVRQQGDKRFANKQKYAKPIAGSFHPKTGKPIQTDTSYSSIEEYEDAGVAPMILAIHGIDAATMVLMLDSQAGLNVHDAYAYGLDVVMEGTDQFNKHFYDVNKELSVVGEVSSAVEDSLMTFKKNSTPAMRTELNKLIKKRRIDGVQDIDGYLVHGTNALGTIQEQKDNTTARIKEVSQYHTEGGAHDVEAGLTQDVLNEIVLDDLKDMIVEEDIQEYIGLVEPTNSQVRFPRHVKAADKSEAEVVTKAAGMLLVQVTKQLRRDKLNSGTEDIDVNNFHSVYGTNVNNNNSVKVFDDLAKMGTVKDSAVHLRNLRDTLSTMAKQILTPIALSLADVKSGETHGVLHKDANEIYINNSVGSIENSIQMSTNETYVHEIVHAVTADGVDGSSWAARELKKLFAIAEKNIKPEDFLNPGAHPGSKTYAKDLEAAQARYDHIFANTKIDFTGRSNHLHEFVAIGLTNANFMRALAKIDGTVISRNPRTVWEGISDIFNAIVNNLTARITQTGRMKADAKLRVLAEQLAGIDHRHKSMVYRAYDATAKFTTALVSTLYQYVSGPLTKLMQTDRVRNSKNTLVKLGGKYGRVIVNSSFADYLKVFNRVMGRFNWVRDGFLAVISTEARGQTKENLFMHRLSRMSNKLIDQLRLDIQTKVAAHLLSTFSVDLTQDDKNSLTRALIKTDAVVLLDHGYSLNGLLKLLRSKSALQTEIDKHTADLNQYGDNRYFYMKQARNMGLMMATGISREHLTLRNAHNIAELMDTGATQVGDIEKAAATIDQLATLYAIQYTDGDELRLAGDVVESELATDQDLNGVAFMLKEHANAKSEAALKNFAGNERLIVKGHTKEILDPDVTVTTAVEDDVPELLKQGWQVVKKLEHDPSHPLAGHGVYQLVNKTGLRAGYDAGVVSLTSEKANGTDLIKVRQDLGQSYITALDDANKVFLHKAPLISDMFEAKDTRVEVGVTMLVQIHNNQGGVAGYRYMMTERNKIELMGKDDSFDAVLGHMQANVVDKVESTKMNREVVNALFEDFNDNFAEDPRAFVTIGPDTEYAEIFAMLPQDMKDEIKSVWGGKEMQVRRNLVRLTFGQRKWSVGQLKEQSIEEAEGLAKVTTMFNNTLVKMFGGPKARTVEQLWQEVVRAVKDAIVIKTGLVTAGNIGSNLILLRVLGVSMKDIVKDHAKAMNGAVEYRRLKTEKDTIERNLRHGFSKNVKRDEIRLARVNTEIQNNPIRVLDEAGIYQSIVEDIDTVDTQFSKLGKIEKFVKPATDLIPQIVKQGGQQVFLTHETTAYKVLRETAQLSDFVARYTLHQHNMKQKNKDGTPKYTEAESLDMIVEMFVNYDLPTHKGLQYANDMGLVMFTKFFIRTQKVIFHIFKERPGSTLATILLQKWFGDVSEIVDSSMLTQDYYGKLNFDVPKLIGQLTNIPTINLVR